MDLYAFTARVSCVTALLAPARAQEFFSVELRAPSDWDVSMLPASRFEQLQGQLHADGEPAVIAALDRLSPALRDAVLYGGRFAGYGDRGERLYLFDRPPADESAVEEWVSGQIGTRVTAHAFGRVAYPAGDLTVGCGPALADRLREVEPGRPLFDLGGRSFMLDRVIAAPELPTYATVAPEDELEPLVRPEEVIELLALQDVTSVSSDHVWRMSEEQVGQFLPNDEYYAQTQQWALWSIGARYAWRYVRASPALVAVIDTGIDPNHPDLQCNLWRDPGDDAYGLDVSAGASDSRQAVDEHGHGTHMAGIIGAVGDNGIGVTGVCWQVDLLTIRIAKEPYVENAGATVAAAVRAALAQDADVINLSYVLLDDTPLLTQVFKEASDADVVVVTPASYPNHPAVYPASYDFDNIVTVMGVDATYAPYDVSGTPKEDVDIAAPAQSIYGPVPVSKGEYAARDGVSTATALVSGAVALLKGHPDYADLSALELKRLLVSHARPVPSLSGLCEAGGVLDLEFVPAPTGASVWEAVSGDLDFPNTVLATATVKEASGAVVELEFCGDGLRERVRRRAGQPITVFGKRPSPARLKVVDFE